MGWVAALWAAVQLLSLLLYYGVSTSTMGWSRSDMINDATECCPVLTMGCGCMTGKRGKTKDT